MSTQAVKGELSSIGKYWWLLLISGGIWIFASILILQLNTTSVKTVGVVVGIAFIVAGVEDLMVASVVDGWKWLWILFGILLILGGLYALTRPGATALALADVLGFLFAMVGLFWIIEALMTKDSNEIWWLGLVAGILMVVLGFMSSGNYLAEKLYTLLVFTGIWLLMKGIFDIIRAFQVRRMGKIATKLADAIPA